MSAVIGGRTVLVLPAVLVIAARTWVFVPMIACRGTRMLSRGHDGFMVHLGVTQRADHGLEAGDGRDAEH